MYIFGNNGLPDNLGFHRLQINNFSRFFDRKQNKEPVSFSHNYNWNELENN